jgi:hypothetical protein
MASDRLARQLLNMTTDPNVADPVKLAAIKDALDRSGLAAKTAVAVEVGVKPYELVFDAIVSGPRDPEKFLAIEGESLDHDDPPDDSEITIEATGEDLLRIQQQRESESDAVIDLEIEDAGYTDEIMSDGSGTTTPDQDQTDLSVDLGATPLVTGPLGLGGPVGSGLMSLSDAVEAAAEMRRRANLRDMRRS